MTDPEQDKPERIRQAERAVLDYTERVQHWTELREARLSELKLLDPENHLLKKFVPRFGRFTGIRPWIAANRVLHETPGRKMNEKQLVELLVKEGCASDKRPRGGPKAAVRSGLRRSYQSMRLVKEGNFVMLGPKAPRAGEENEREE